MKKIISLFMVLTMVLSLAACSTNQSPSESTPEESSSQTNESTPTPSNTNGKNLVVYFSMPDNVDDSTVVIDGETLGNTQYMAYVIQETVGADIFRIEPETPYPTDHDELVDLASEEQSNNARPAIKDTIENFDTYENIFVGYPNWWGDMPMILYSLTPTAAAAFLVQFPQSKSLNPTPRCWTANLSPAMIFKTQSRKS